MKIFEEDRSNPFAGAFYQFIDLSGRIEMGIKKSLQSYELTHAQLNVLYLLAKNYPGVLNPADIKKQLIVSNPDVTRMIDRLVTKKWVNRETCSENRRKVNLRITQEGIEVFEEAHNAAKKAVGDFFSNSLNKTEAIQLWSTLKKIEL